MALTIQTLLRIPEFAAVRLAIRQGCEESGSAQVRALLSGPSIVFDKTIRDWLSVPEAETYQQRMQALLLAIEEWENES